MSFSSIESNHVCSHYKIYQINDINHLIIHQGCCFIFQVSTLILWITIIKTKGYKMCNESQGAQKRMAILIHLMYMEKQVPGLLK